jgi:glucokinase
MWLGIEIGGTKLQIGVGDADGNVTILVRQKAPAAEGASAILAWIQSAVNDVLQQEPWRGGIRGIGIGFGGPVETSTGTVLVSHQVHGWAGMALKSWSERVFGLPTIVANDANAAGWAEYRRGIGRGTDPFFYMNIGSGIGGSLVFHGMLYDGQGCGAGEIGHTYVPWWDADGTERAVKLEEVCSGWAIERRIRQWHDLAPQSPLYKLCEGRPERLTCAHLGEAARQGDARAREEIDRVARTLALALCNVLALFQPKRIALGGGVPLMGDVLLEPLRRYTAAYVFGPMRDRYEILPCALGETVVVVGAVLLAGEAAT